MINRIEIKIKGKANKKEYKSLSYLAEKLNKKYKAETEIHFKNGSTCHYISESVINIENK